MNAFALTLALTLGPADLVEDRLPICLAETLAEPAAKADPEWWVGAHLGVAGAYDAEDPTFLIGVNGRVHILPWLGAEASLDFQLKQSFEHNQIHVFQVPFEFSALFYPPVGDSPIRPYGMAGIGFTITDVSYSGSLSRSDTTDPNLLFYLGFGAEFELEPNIALDANLRFVFVQDPPHFSGNSADWIQFTVGVMFKLSK
jgi:opacity protein-like surface antigen